VSRGGTATGRGFGRRRGARRQLARSAKTFPSVSLASAMTNTEQARMCHPG
jgi:hypothetical protein